MKKVVGISFDHTHMGDLLRQVHDHPGAMIAGICDPDPARMAQAIANFAIPPDAVFTDIAACMATGPDLVILCPATARHAEHVEAVAPYGAAILVEKPFAASLADADRMIAAAARGGCRMAINWPLVWYPPHITAKRLVDQGAIGALTQVHFHDGNRGPLFHRADKVAVTPAQVAAEKPAAWWYQAASGGGSLLDYLGYGATLGTWFMNGAVPIEVTAVTDRPTGLEVDEHSITILRYAGGLSKMETRWGTLTDPWTIQPQPKCGFVLVGTDGSIGSGDYDDHITLQTRAHPAVQAVPNDPIPAPHRGPVEYVLHCLDSGAPFHGPLDPAIARIGQRIVDTAAASAKAGRTLALLG